MEPGIFIELSKILLVTLGVTGIMKILKQPLVIGYIISGILVGPVFLNLVTTTETFLTFSQIGVAVLLFMVGLSLNPRVIKEVGKVSLITGLGQVIFTSTIGFLIIRAFGFSLTASLYIAIALTFSSTIIIMKLLSDKKALETLYGRISIGFLIVQDFVAIAILLIISSLNQGTDLTSLILGSLLKGIGLILVIFIISKYVLPSLTKRIAHSQEFLLLFSIGWCFVISSVFYFFNFSIEAGALIAGISLSVTPYHHEISSRMRPIRDFFLILFFIILGSQMIFANVLQNLTTIIILSLFVLIGNPIIVMILMGLLGYTKRNGFMSGLTVAQISEFSLIVVALGVSVGHVTNEVLSTVTAIGLITFAGSTYMILYSNKIYPVISKFLTIFEKKGKKKDEHFNYKDQHYDIVLMGYNRIGFDVLEALKKLKKKFLVIDYDPEVIIDLNRKGYDCTYGDADDAELLDKINFSKTKMVVSTIPDYDTNMLLIKRALDQNKKAIVSVVAYQINDAIRLYEEGATYVLMPHFLGGKHFATIIQQNKLDFKKFLKEKSTHINHLNKRKKHGHEHPKHERN